MYCGDGQEIIANNVVRRILKIPVRCLGIIGSENLEKIQSIELGVSDAHNMGRTVARLLFGNGKRVMYKPRGLEKEIIYQQAYDYLSGRLNLDSRQRKIKSCNHYSWEEYAETEECKSEVEVKRFFSRMGIQLFLCYLLNASDIHAENVVASGEYPEFIDLEVMLGFGHITDMSVNDEKQAVGRFLQNSVLHTGVLPSFLWGDGEDGTEGQILFKIILL